MPQAVLDDVVAAHAASDVVACARAEFLATGKVPPGIRACIDRSWRRSASAGVSPEHPAPRWVGLPAGETALLRAARPVIDELFVQLQGSRAATMLVDSDAVIVNRWSNAASVLEHLDEISACPGYSFDEASVGTTALGTVIEEGQPVVVRRCEHYASVFHSVSAVGAPVRHPITGRLEGVVDLVLPAEEESSLMLPLIVRAAEEISARLLSGYSAADRHLLDGFLRTDRRGSRVPTIAINNRIEMSNHEASAVIGTVDRVLLWEQVQRAQRCGETETVLVVGGDRELPARLIDVRDGDVSVGVVVQFRTGSATTSSSSDHEETGGADRLLELLPGSSMAWRAAIRGAGAAATARRRALLVGGPGTGKRALAMAMATLVHPGRPTTEFDARDAAEMDGGTWLRGVAAHLSAASACTVILHVDELDDEEAVALSRMIDATEIPGRPVFATFTLAGDKAAVLSAFEARFPFLVHVPELSERVEDIPDIAERMLFERTEGERRRLDPRVVHRLIEREWPGNARQLGLVIDAAIAVAPGSVVRPEDLPDGFRDRNVRLQLSRLGRVERDAIRDAMRQAQGNKRLAAAALGISRSTLYRKLEAHALSE